jgi:hypothetical protein
MNILAGTIPLYPTTATSRGFRGFGPLGLEGIFNAREGFNVFARVISSTVALLTVIAFIWFSFKLVIGAIGIISAGGDKGKLAKSREDITNGLVGLVIVISAIFIVGLLGILFDIDILNLSDLIFNLRL